jgi:protein SCO1/2
LLKIALLPNLNSSIKTVKITNETYKVYVFKFFFTTCLPFVKNESKYVGAGKEFFGNPNFGMVSITIDPEHDTAKVLRITEIFWV